MVYMSCSVNAPNKQSIEYGDPYGRLFRNELAAAGLAVATCRGSIVEPLPVMSSSQRPLILIADDNEDNRELYASYLRANGYGVVKARDGAEAIAIARARKPALVVLDLHMPRVDGLRAARVIRRDATIRATPILVVTADDTHQQDALDAGANAVCLKPYTPDALLNHIEEMLSVSADID
jgi:two-component system cell cycle response regulator DivK